MKSHWYNFTHPSLVHGAGNFDEAPLFWPLNTLYIVTSMWDPNMGTMCTNMLFWTHHSEKSTWSSFCRVSDHSHSRTPANTIILVSWCHTTVNGKKICVWLNFTGKPKRVCCATVQVYRLEWILLCRSDTLLCMYTSFRMKSPPLRSLCCPCC